MTHGEILLALRLRMREERRKNTGEAKGALYGPAYIKVTHLVEVWHEGRCVNPADESVLTTVWWDHSEASVEEAVDMAERGAGKVYIGQYLYMSEALDAEEDEHNPADPEGLVWVGEGIEFEVWPQWTGEVRA